MYTYIYIQDIQDVAGRLLEWFSENQMKGNTDKCHLLMSTNKSLEIHICESIIKSGDCEKKLIQNFIFDNHV